MLKLTYIETGLHLECVAAPLEVLIAQRVVLALRTGQTLLVEPGRASFLLPANATGLAHLKSALQSEQSQTISVTAVDEEFVEVSLQGSWLAETAAAHEGMFVTAFSEQTELFVYQLWQATQCKISSIA